MCANVFRLLAKQAWTRYEHWGKRRCKGRQSRTE